MEEIKTIKSNSQLLQESEIKSTDEIKEDPVCLSIIEGAKEIPLFTLGNFSSIIGKAKSRKTFLLTLFLGCMAGLGTLQGKFRKNSTGKVILFDTEQSSWYVQKVVKRVEKLAENNKLFTAYGLRPFAPQKRIELIEDCLYNTEGIKFVAIDGIRDLVRNINSEEEATEIVSKFMKWTHELNIHIITVIHMNKADMSARGHIGTEVQNKSEAVLSVSKDVVEDIFSIVEHKFAKGLDFEDFCFSIEGGLPEVSLKEHEKETSPF